MRRQREFLDAVRRSRRLHACWVIPPASAPAYRRYLTRSRRATQVAFFTPHAGHGLMREGLSQVIAHAFTKLKLHRLEANIQPGNRPSIRLVRTLGFRREGLSPRYLHIAGTWRDHERWALLKDDWVLVKEDRQTRRRRPTRR